MSLNICIDIDGTITSPYYFLPFLNKLMGTSLTEKEYISTNWNLVFGEDRREEFLRFDEVYPESYDGADLVENARDVINRLSTGNNIYFVTARKPMLKERTIRWLNKNGLGGHKLFMLGHDNKSQLAKLLGCDIFIEDNPENAVSLNKDGFKVILMDANYNRNIDNKGIKRVSNWIEIEDYIKRFR